MSLPPRWAYARWIARRHRIQAETSAFKSRLTAQAQAVENEFVAVAVVVAELPNVRWLDIKKDIDFKTYENNNKIVGDAPLDKCCAVSWRWLPIKGMDLDHTALNILGMAKQAGYQYAWFDRCCLPQLKFDIQMVVNASTVYDHINVLCASLSKEFDPGFTYLVCCFSFVLPFYNNLG